jgi:antitoxin Phd
MAGQTTKPVRQAKERRPAVWKLEDAKARFSELVRRARDQGPQRVTVRGKPAVVVVDAEEFESLKPKQSLGEFLQSLTSLAELDLSRDYPPDRDPLEFLLSDDDESLVPSGGDMEIGRKRHASARAKPNDRSNKKASGRRHIA